MCSSFSPAVLVAGPMGSAGPATEPSQRAKSTRGGARSTQPSIPVSGCTTTSEPSQRAFWPVPESSPTSSSARRRARISARPTAKRRASTETDCSSSSSVSSTSADLFGLALRTALRSELAALTGSSSHWSERATPAGRSWYVLRTSARRTDEHGSGSLLPTPRESDGDRGGRGDLLQVLRGNPSPSGHFSMPTPTAGDAKAARNRTAGRKPGSKHHDGVTLVDWWRMNVPDRILPTVRATDADRGPDPTSHSSTLLTQLPAFSGRRSRFAFLVMRSWMMGLPKSWLETALSIEPPARRKVTPSSRKSPTSSGGQCDG